MSSSLHVLLSLSRVNRSWASKRWQVLFTVDDNVEPNLTKSRRLIKPFFFMKLLLMFLITDDFPSSLNRPAASSCLWSLRRRWEILLRANDVRMNELLFNGNFYVLFNCSFSFIALADEQRATENSNSNQSGNLYLHNVNIASGGR